jgi:dTDP-4-dehydrorhamnose reductase
MHGCVFTMVTSNTSTNDVFAASSGSPLDTDDIAEALLDLAKGAIEGGGS